MIERGLDPTTERILKHVTRILFVYGVIGFFRGLIFAGDQFDAWRKKRREQRQWTRQ